MSTIWRYTESMDWRYIAGFFDGEGTIAFHHRGYRVRITISQTNFEVLEQIRDFTKVGSVVEIRKRKKHWKDAWVYYISKQADIVKFLKGIEPNLVLKKELARKSIADLGIRLRERRREDQRLVWRIRRAKKLRSEGLTYRAIGSILSIDHGYTRKLVKFH